MKSLLALLAGTAIAAGTATPAMAAPASPMPPAEVRAAETAGDATDPVRAVIFTIESGQGSQSPSKYAFLNCRPVGGSHPAAATVCAALEKAGGNIANLQPRKDVACSMLYDPVTVTANGIWDGRYFWFRRTFGNRCQMQAIEGDVFNI